MIREDISGCSEPPCPRRKTTPWAPIVFVVLVALGVAHLAGLTKPLATLALQLSGGGRTPGWRLVGDWQSDNDPMFQRVCHLTPRKNYHGTGVYMGDAGRGMCAVPFKILSEDHSGSQVEMLEYVVGKDANYRVRYSIAEDGKSMTREYDARNGEHISCQYRYLGPPTEDPPREFLPK